MGKIVCYGDSNTFGFNPENGVRFDEKIRWSGILANLTQNCYEIIEEGANNRTGFVNNPSGFLYSAQRHFPKIISKIKDIDIIILSIGTNDLQEQYNIGFNAIEKGLETLILCAKNYSGNIILVPPIVLDNNVLSGYFNTFFNEESIIKSRKVGRIYKKLARVFNCRIFDFNEFARPSVIDGLHYDINSHKLIAEKLADFINKNY